MPNLTTEESSLLAPHNFVSIQYPFLVCVPKSTAPAGNWTQDLLLSGWMLYLLSYRGSWEFSAHNALEFDWSMMVRVQPARWQHLPTHNMPFLHYFEPHSTPHVGISRTVLTLITQRSISWMSWFYVCVKLLFSMLFYFGPLADIIEVIDTFQATKVGSLKSRGKLVGNQ